MKLEWEALKSEEGGRELDMEMFMKTLEQVDKAVSVQGVDLSLVLVRCSPQTTQQ